MEIIVISNHEVMVVYSAAVHHPLLRGQLILSRDRRNAAEAALPWSHLHSTAEQHKCKDWGIGWHGTLKRCLQRHTQNRAKLLACRRGPKPQLPPGTRCACPDPGLVCPTHGWPALRPGAPRGHIWQHSTSIPCAQYPLAGRGALPDTSCNRLHTNIGPFVTKEPGLLGAQTEAQGMQKLHVQ